MKFSVEEVGTTDYNHRQMVWSPPKPKAIRHLEEVVDNPIPWLESENLFQENLHEEILKPNLVGRLATLPVLIEQS